MDLPAGSGAALDLICHGLGLRPSSLPHLTTYRYPLSVHAANDPKNHDITGGYLLQYKNDDFNASAKVYFTATASTLDILFYYPRQELRLSLHAACWWNIRACWNHTFLATVEMPMSPRSPTSGTFGTAWSQPCCRAHSWSVHNRAF